MTDTSLPVNRFTAGEFRVGRVLSRSMSVFGRNLLPFSLVTAIASLPNLLFFSAEPAKIVAAGAWMIVLPFVITFVLYMLAQAVVLHAAFQDMRGQRVDLIESAGIGLRRLLPIVGISLLWFAAAAVVFIVPTILIKTLFLISAGLGLLGSITSFILFFFGFFLLITMWFVAVPVCVVERLGPLTSMIRSAELTKGYRWALFGLLLLLAVVGLVVGAVAGVVGHLGGSIASGALQFVIGAVWGAFAATLIAVTYHDVRVAKEGVDTEQIAAVFD